MLKYTRSAIGLLTRLYRSVLQKCWLINIGVWALGAVGKTVSTLLPQTLRGTLSPESTNVLEKLLQTALMSGSAAGEDVAELKKLLQKLEQKYGEAAENGANTFGKMTNVPTHQVSQTPDGGTLTSADIKALARLLRNVLINNNVKENELTDCEKSAEIEDAIAGLLHNEGLLNGGFNKNSRQIWNESEKSANSGAVSEASNGRGQLEYGVFKLIADLLQIVRQYKEFMKKSYRNLHKNLVTTTALTMSLVGAVMVASTTNAQAASVTAREILNYMGTYSNGAATGTLGNVVWHYSPDAEAASSLVFDINTGTGSGTVAVPVGDKSYYFTYDYQVPEGYTRQSGAGANSVTNKYFYNMGNTTAWTGTPSGTFSVKAEFLGNVGAVYYHGSNTATGSFTGNFIGNEGTGWEKGTIVNGYNYNLSFNGDFIGNSNRYPGGALYLYQPGADTHVVDEIIGNFIGNKATTGDGGAISVHIRGIERLEGNFIGNSTNSVGGAISRILSGRYGSGQYYINNLHGNFIGNKAAYKGGAIAIGEGSNNLSYSPYLDVKFTGNNYFAENKAAGILNDIYNAGNIYILDGVTELNSGFDGASDAKLIIESGAAFDLNENNGEIHTSMMGNVTNNGTFTLGIDLQHSDKTADKFNFTSQTGTILLDAINEVDERPLEVGNYDYTIFTGSYGNWQIATDLQDDWTMYTTVANGGVLNADSLWTDTYLGTATFTQGSLTNNGGHLIYSITSSTTADTIDNAYILSLINRDSDNDTKTFTATSATETYTSGINLGATKGSLTVSGVLSGDNRSSIDLGNNKGFRLEDEAVNLTLKDLSISGGKEYTARVTDTAAILTLNNAIVTGAPIIGTDGTINYIGDSDTTNAQLDFGGTVYINPSNISGGIYHFNNNIRNSNIKIGSAVTTNDTTLKLGMVLDNQGAISSVGQFDDGSVSLTNNIGNAVLDTQNSYIDTNVLNSLTLNNPLKLAIDVSLNGNSADTIAAGSVSAAADSLIIGAIDVGSYLPIYHIQITDDPVLMTAYTLSDDIMNNITGASAANIASVSYDNTTGYLTFRTMTPTTPDNISPEAETVDYSAKAPDLSGITDGSGSSGGYLKPTLSYIKSHTAEGSESAEGTAHYANLSSGEHAQYELSTTQGENTHSVYIDGTKYWYTPNESGDDAAVKNAELINLLSTGTAALTEVADYTGNWVVHVGDKYYAYDATKLPESAYTLQNGSSGAINFSVEDKSYSVAMKELGHYKTTGNSTFDTAQYKYFKWTTDANGVRTLTESGATSTDNDVAAKYNNYTKVTSVIANIDNTNATNKNFQIASKTARAYGGAIVLQSKSLDSYNVIANFIDNGVTKSGTGSNAGGGAIYVENSTIGDIVGDFITNSAEAKVGVLANGGAIAINGTSKIKSITGDFIGNWTKSTTNNSGGGAIQIGNASASIGIITGNFIGNTSSSNSGLIYGGAVLNKGTIGNITGDFIGNTALTQGALRGGAIFNNDSGIISSITGDFIENSIMSTTSTGRGGAIYNFVATIGDITGNFVNNSVTSSSSGNGGAITNDNGTSVIGNITGDFIGNIVTGSSASGGAVYNRETSSIGNVTGNFIGNSAIADSNGYGGAIFNQENFGNIEGNFLNNSVVASKDTSIFLGGAIYNENTNSSNATLGLLAQNNDIWFYNNIITNGTNTRYNDIYNSGTINMNAASGKSIHFGGTIEGSSGVLNLNTDSTNYGGTYEFNNAISGHTINLGSSTGTNHPSTLRLGGIIQANGSPTYGSLDNTDTLVNYANNSILDTRNVNMDANVVSTLDLQNNTLHWMLDASLIGMGSDTLNATSVTDGVLNLNTINLGNMAQKVDVKLTDNAELAQNIDLPSNYQLEGSMAKFVESVSYNKDNGILTFTTKTPSGDDSGVASPYIKVNPVEKTGTSAWKDDDGASWVDREPVAAEAYGYGDIAIGDGAKAGVSDTTKDDYNRSYATAIGYNAQATGTNSTALGHGAVAYAQGSVALGLGSITGSATEGDQKNTDDAYVISVGSGNADDASTYQYRRIINVKEGEGDNDAVNVKQLNAAISGVTITFDENITQNGTKAVTSGTIAQHLSNNYSRKLTKINTFCDGLDGKIRVANDNTATAANDNTATVATARAVANIFKKAI